jgi:hypothetical protein
MSLDENDAAFRLLVLRRLINDLLRHGLGTQVSASSRIMLNLAKYVQAHQPEQGRVASSRAFKLLDQLALFLATWSSDWIEFVDDEVNSQVQAGLIDLHKVLCKKRKKAQQRANLLVSVPMATVEQVHEKVPDGPFELMRSMRDDIRNLANSVSANKDYPWADVSNVRSKLAVESLVEESVLYMSNELDVLQQLAVIRHAVGELRGNSTKLYSRFADAIGVSSDLIAWSVLSGVVRDVMAYKDSESQIYLDETREELRQAFLLAQQPGLKRIQSAVSRLIAAGQLK